MSPAAFDPPGPINTAALTTTIPVSVAPGANGGIFTPTQSFVLIDVALVGPPVHVCPTALIAMTASAAAPVSVAPAIDIEGAYAASGAWERCEALAIARADAAVAGSAGT